jgi:hypothetical protein
MRANIENRGRLMLKTKADCGCSSKVVPSYAAAFGGGMVDKDLDANGESGVICILKIGFLGSLYRRLR